MKRKSRTCIKKGSKNQVKSKKEVETSSRRSASRGASASNSKPTSSVKPALSVEKKPSVNESSRVNSNGNSKPTSTGNTSTGAASTSVSTATGSTSTAGNSSVAAGNASTSAGSSSIAVSNSSTAAVNTENNKPAAGSKAESSSSSKPSREIGVNTDEASAVDKSERPITVKIVINKHQKEFNITYGNKIKLIFDDLEKTEEFYELLHPASSENKTFTGWEVSGINKRIKMGELKELVANEDIIGREGLEGNEKIIIRAIFYNRNTKREEVMDGVPYA